MSIHSQPLTELYNIYREEFEQVASQSDILNTIAGLIPTIITLCKQRSEYTPSEELKTVLQFNDEVSSVDDLLKPKSTTEINSTLSAKDFTAKRQLELGLIGSLADQQSKDISNPESNLASYVSLGVLLILPQLRMSIRQSQEATKEVLNTIKEFIANLDPRENPEVNHINSQTITAINQCNQLINNIEGDLSTLKEAYPKRLLSLSQLSNKPTILDSLMTEDELKQIESFGTKVEEKIVELADKLDTLDSTIKETGLKLERLQQQESKQGEVEKTHLGEVDSSKTGLFSIAKVKVILNSNLVEIDNAEVNNQLEIQLPITQRRDDTSPQDNQIETVTRNVTPSTDQHSAELQPLIVRLNSHLDSFDIFITNSNGYRDRILSFILSKESISIDDIAKFTWNYIDSDKDSAARSWNCILDKSNGNNEISKRWNYFLDDRLRQIVAAIEQITPSINTLGEGKHNRYLLLITILSKLNKEFELDGKNGSIEPLQMDILNIAKSKTEILKDENSEENVKKIIVLYNHLQTFNVISYRETISDYNEVILKKLAINKQLSTEDLDDIHDTLKYQSTVSIFWLKLKGRDNFNNPLIAKLIRNIDKDFSLTSPKKYAILLSILSRLNTDLTVAKIEDFDETQTELLKKAGIIIAVETKSQNPKINITNKPLKDSKSSISPENKTELDILAGIINNVSKKFNPYQLKIFGDLSRLLNNYRSGANRDRKSIATKIILLRQDTMDNLTKLMPHRKLAADLIIGKFNSNTYKPSSTLELYASLDEVAIIAAAAKKLSAVHSECYKSNTSYVRLAESDKKLMNYALIQSDMYYYTAKFFEKII